MMSHLSHARAGTRRQSAAGKIASGQTPAAAARALLRASAVNAIQQRSQWQPPAFAGQPAPPAAPETLETIRDPALVAAMHALLKYPELLFGPRLLHSLRCAGLRLPHRLLPRALHIAHGQYARLRWWILPMLGTHGRWLARHGAPRWAWAQDGGISPQSHDIDTVWRSGNVYERFDLLQRERARAPQAARARLEAHFADMKADGRRQLLTVLARNLSPSDEDFLERCLKERSSPVRLVAAHLLSALPGKRRSQRISAILHGLLRQDADGHWQLEMPAAFPAAWKNEGIAEQHLHLSLHNAHLLAQNWSNWSSGLKECQAHWAWPVVHRWQSQAGWLEDLAAGAPLAFWQETLGMDAAGCCAWARQTPYWSRALEAGWLRAALLPTLGGQPWNDVWMQALLGRARRHTARLREDLVRLGQSLGRTHEEIAAVTSLRLSAGSDLDDPQNNEHFWGFPVWLSLLDPGVRDAFWSAWLQTGGRGRGRLVDNDRRRDYFVGMFRTLEQTGEGLTPGFSREVVCRANICWDWIIPLLDTSVATSAAEVFASPHPDMPRLMGLLRCCEEALQGMCVSDSRARG